MIKTAPISINNRIDDLKQELSRNDVDNLEYVVIAHSDSQMIAQIKEAFVDSSIAVISVPQSSWEMESQPMDQFMEWLLNDLNVTRVLLVGHSQGGSPHTKLELCSSGNVDPVSSDGSSNRVASMFERVRNAQVVIRQNEKHFLQELECLKSLPSVQKHLLRNQQCVQGLFYRVESGEFCHHDRSTGQFRALFLDI